MWTDFRTARAAAPNGEVLMPGEPERRTRAQRLTEGIPLTDEVWNAIAAVGRERGVEVTAGG